ncbi:alpha/beta fold hydrolase [Sinomonas sp. ASV486]|uniref:alpha/beta hydrolase n=1 Tax=Sinomonas sp. ASV486 TaxID=3051170 RepID=UPI0027DD4A33|nr:alpha/beta fold hydrolase [Sinomonas sp. ASV486]MDQ4489761.1 alpha/beta fold hydrolase [Sinomonas sp. ASV486]
MEHMEGGVRPLRLGVALCHGFSGSPSSVKPWADGLAERGFDVEAPLLPGHGTSWRDLEKRRWHEWTDSFSAACAAVAARTDILFLAGLSMGGTIALHTAARRSAAEGHGPVPPVAGIAVVNPGLGFYDQRARFIGVYRLLMRTTGPIDEADAPQPVGDEGDYSRTPIAAVHELKRLFHATDRVLPRVTVPLIAFKSDVDPVVPPSSLARIVGRVSSPEVQVVPLHGSPHVATRGPEARLIIDRTADTFDRWAEHAALHTGIGA